MDHARVCITSRVFFFEKQFSVEVTAPLILGDISAAKDVASHVPCTDLLGSAKDRDESKVMQAADSSPC